MNEQELVEIKERYAKLGDEDANVIHRLLEKIDWLIASLHNRDTSLETYRIEVERLTDQVSEFRAALDDMHTKAFEREKMIEGLKALVVQGDQLRLKEVAEVDRLRAELEKIKSIIFVTAINAGRDEFGRDGYNAVVTFDRETLGYVAEGQTIGKVAEALKGGEG